MPKFWVAVRFVRGCCPSLSLFVAAIATIFIPHSSVFAAPAQISFETQLSDSTVSGLAASAAGYRSTKKKSGVRLTVATHVGAIPLELKPIDIRGKNYRAELTTANGRVRDPIQVDLFEADPDSTGKVEFARVALITDPATHKQKVEGFLRSDNTYYQVTQAYPGEKQLTTMRLSESQIANLLQRCGVDHEKLNLQVGPVATSTTPQAAESSLPTASATTYKELQLATDADFEFVSGLGSGTSANAEILSTLSSVDAIYRAQLGIRIVVTYQHAWTTSDPYSTNVINALDDFASYWELNFRDGETYDLAHLFSGRSYGSTLGVAWVGSICGSPIYEYGLSATLNGYQEYDVVVTAHELGHNLGANHDQTGTCENIYIMCPTAGSTSQFSPASLSSIAATISGTSCMANTDGPDPDPREESPSLSVAIRGNKVRYTVKNTGSCDEVEIIGAKSQSALNARSGVTTIGSFTGDSATQVLESTNVHRFKNGSASGKLYFDLNCDSSRQSLNKTIRASKIDSRRRTQNLGTVLRDLRNNFE